MANKRYYWLKLQDNFFQNPKIKKLRKIAGGDTYTVIYLKLMLNTIKSDGRFYYEGIEESLEEEIALKLDEDVENVQMALAYLFKHNLLEEVSESEFEIPEVQSNIGSETASTQRSREHRIRKNKEKALQCNTNATQTQHLCNVEKEIEKEKELEIDKEIEVKEKKTKPAKHKYGEYKKVLLTDDEFNKLKEEYPLSHMTIIQYLDEYKEMYGKSYKNDYLAIKKWVINACKEKNLIKDVNTKEIKQSVVREMKKVNNDFEDF